ncbi:39S ribosomal protein L44, mitochondrial [Cichlidogyrus casuarinus]|uniref:Large ribosomal subunit protein mL44 n=1 Tax=Cichlidogyrus casuarinus TaxID=1844966 RepID=A0ABD2Q9F3_9PLAT
MLLHIRAQSFVKQLRKNTVAYLNSMNDHPIRNFSQANRTVRPKLRDLYQRRLAQGPEPYRHRSQWHPWNYNAEIFAFHNRLRLPIAETSIKKALVDATYGEKFKTESNSELAQNGIGYIKTIVSEFLKNAYPKMPGDWLELLVVNYSNDVHLAYIGSHLGINDILLYHPMTEAPANSEISKSFCALVQSSIESNHETFAREMILNFIVKPITVEEIISDENLPEMLLKNPVEYASKLMGGSQIEFRIINQAAMNSMLSAYNVGAFIDKQLYASSLGETIEHAVEEAAKETAFKYVGIADHLLPQYAKL